MINFDDTTNFNCAELTNVRIDPLTSLPTYTESDYNRLITQGGRLFLGYGSWHNLTYTPTVLPYYYIMNDAIINNSENIYNDLTDLLNLISTNFTNSETIIIDIQANTPNITTGYGNLSIDRANTHIILRQGATLNEVSINAANISIIGEGAINELSIDANAVNTLIDGVKITGSITVHGEQTRIYNTKIGLNLTTYGEQIYIKNTSIWNLFSINSNMLQGDVIATNCSIDSSASNVKLNINGLADVSNNYLYMLHIYSANNINITSDAIQQLVIEHDDTYKELIITAKRLGVVLITNGSGRLNADYISNTCNGTNYGDAPVTFDSLAGRFIINDAVIKATGTAYAVYLNDKDSQSAVLELQQCHLSAEYSIAPLYCANNTTAIIDNCTLVANKTYTINGYSSANVINYGSVANNTYANVNWLVETLLVDLNVI